MRFDQINATQRAESDEHEHPFPPSPALFFGSFGRSGRWVVWCCKSLQAPPSTGCSLLARGSAMPCGARTLCQNAIAEPGQQRLFSIARSCRPMSYASFTSTREVPPPGRCAGDVCQHGPRTTQHAHTRASTRVPRPRG